MLMSVNVPLTLLFLGLTDYLGFPVETFLLFNCKPIAELVRHLLLCFLGSTEGGCSYPGQQTRRERLNDSGRDLPVPHARLHHNALVACAGLLRPDWRGVSPTRLMFPLLSSLFLSQS